MNRMRCPTLAQLPPPPTGKTGWPWTEESPQLLDSMPDGAPWPKISIVTPSLNQGQFIEETIRSVLLQGYPDLEYIIIDGGSSDQTLDIIKKYEKWIAYWVTEPDQGQANAINKGFKKASGQIVAWLNSDDFYLASIFQLVAENLTDKNSPDFVYGAVNIVSQAGDVIGKFRTREYSFINLLLFNIIPQQSCFWKYSVFQEMGYLNERYDYIMDFEFWVRCGERNKFKYLKLVMANFRMHDDSKTIQKSIEFDKESLSLYEDLLNNVSSLPDGILKNRGKLLREKNERLAMSYYNAKKMTEARRYFIKAICSRFFRIQNLTLFAYIIDTLGGTHCGKYLQSFSNKVQSKFYFLSENLKEKYSSEN